MRTQSPIGILKVNKKVFCSICGCSHTRNLKNYVYDNSTDAINKAKESLAKKANSEYTCRICKSIKG